MTPASGVSPLRHVPVRGALYMLAAVSLLAILDAGVKELTGRYPVPQIGFMRYLFGLTLAVILATRSGGLGTLRTRRPGGHLLRAAFNLTTMLTFYYSLALLPLGTAVSIAFAAPLFMTALSVPMLREHVGPRRWAAVLVGFIGILVILRPSAEGVSLGAILALVSAFCYAVTLITSRQLSTTEASHTILFYYSIGVLFATGATLPWQWVTPAWGDLWIIVLVGVSGSFGQWSLNQAFRFGEVSMLAPIEYISLAWAVLFGFAFWGEVPTWTVIIGAGVVVASSLYITHREAQRAQGRATVAVPGEPAP